jgi:HEAT repeat protein
MTLRTALFTGVTLLAAAWGALSAFSQDPPPPEPAPPPGEKPADPAPPPGDPKPADPAPVEPAPEAPAWPLATPAEARQIGELLARLAMPEELRHPSAADEGGDPGLKPRFDDDPAAWLSKTPEEREAVQKKLAAMAPEERDKFLDAERERLKAEIEANERLRALRSREFAGEGVLPRGVDLPPEKREEEMRKAQEAEARRAEAREERRKRLEEHRKGRSEAVGLLKAFGAKATPFVAEAFGAADLEAGAALLEVAASVPDDPRAHKSILAWLGKQEFAELLPDDTVLVAAARMGIPGIVPALEQAMDRGDPRNNVFFLHAIYQARSRDTIEAVAEVFLSRLKSEVPTIRSPALNFVLMLMPDPALPDHLKALVVRRLAQILSDPEFEKSAPSVIYGLGQSGHPDAVSPLVQALNRSDLAKGAIRALGTLGPVARGAARDVIPFLSVRTPQVVKQEAIRALGNMGNEDAIAPLIDAMGQEGQPVQTRQAAVFALQRLTKQSLGMNAGRWLSWWTEEQNRRAAEGR